MLWHKKTLVLYDKPWVKIHDRVFIQTIFFTLGLTCKNSSIPPHKIMYLCYLIAMNDKSWLVQGSAAVCTAPAAVLYLLI